MKRFLITTAYEKTWRFEEPILFIGEWCKKYNRKHVWGKIDSITAEPIGVIPEEKAKNLIYVQNLTRVMLEELTLALNEFHGKKYSTRYWNILLGHWLIRYVEVAFNRYTAILKAKEEYEISSTVSLEEYDYINATYTSLGYIEATNDDIWNHVFYSQVIKHVGGINFTNEEEVLRNIECYVGPSEKENEIKVKSPFSFTAFAMDVLIKLLPFFKRNNDAFIINSYLPKPQEMKLQLMLGQCPQLWVSPKFKKVRINKELRSKFKLKSSGFNGFEHFLREEIGKHIPVCYFEGYQSLIDQVKNLPWPKNPKFIFTSNNFDTDELFKAWTAEKTEAGTPYFIGQHGNHYGTLDGYNNWPESTTGDKFISWGWRDGSEKNIPATVLKIVGRKPHRPNPNGGLLLIEVYLPHRMLHWDDYYDFGIYQEEQFEFVKALPQKIHEQLKVRLHSQFRQQEWYEDLRWKDASPNTQLETGSARVVDLIANSRLVVHSYDSTGLLETLALNIPTLCFWQRGLSHLVPSAVPYYEKLRSVGIIADGPREAANFIAQNWDNIDKWWNSVEVQRARREFCEEYARAEKDPLNLLKNILNRECRKK